MKKIIDPGREPVIEYYCDGCKRAIAKEPDNLSYAVQLVGNFGYGSGHDGYIFNHAYCDECGIAAIKAIEMALKIEIKAGDNVGFACDNENCDTEESEEENKPLDWESL